MLLHFEYKLHFTDHSIFTRDNFSTYHLPRNLQQTQNLSLNKHIANKDKHFCIFADFKFNSHSHKMQFESQIKTPGTMLSARSIKYADKNQILSQHLCMWNLCTSFFFSINFIPTSSKMPLYLRSLMKFSNYSRILSDPSVCKMKHCTVFLCVSFPTYVRSHSCHAGN